MEDLRSILSSHHSKNGKDETLKAQNSDLTPSVAVIPDLFFDEILVRYKLTRTDILVLMFLYRTVWCKPNLHRKYGITPMISHTDLSRNFEIDMDALHQSLRRLEDFKFIETIRVGQYFVRKYFSEENDRKYNQTYDNFL